MISNNTTNNYEYSDYSTYDYPSSKSSLRKGLEYLILTVALAFSTPLNSIQAQQQSQQDIHTTIKTKTNNNSIMYKDTCNYPPKYKELQFLRKSGQDTFSAKEMWTLNKGNGTDLLALYCDSSSIYPLHNLLELMDFKDKTIKSHILSREYTTIEDDLNREFMKIETKNGTRYFSIQTRDKENDNMIDIDGTIHYDALKNHGNKMLRLYIEMGKEMGIDSKTGKIKIQSLDSGDLIIPYYDCANPIIPINTNNLPAISNTPAGNTIINITNNFDFSTHTNVTIDNQSPQPILEKKPVIVRDSLNTDQLSISLLGSFANDAIQKKLYECGEFDINTMPRIWKIAAYARTLNNIHINTEFNHLHAEASLLDPNKNNIGDYGITADDLLLDARINFLKSHKAGFGIGGIFEYNASTQKGNANQNGNQYTLDANNSRISGLLGLILFADDAKFDIGAYAGHSNQLGTLFNVTARLNNIYLGKILDINSHLFIETYNGSHHNGNRAGFEAIISGPLIIGLLRPSIGYEIDKTIYSGNNSGLETGLRKSILVGVTADFGGTKTTHK